MSDTLSKEHVISRQVLSGDGKQGPFAVCLYFSLAPLSLLVNKRFKCPQGRVKYHHVCYDIMPTSSAKGTDAN